MHRRRFEHRVFRRRAAGVSTCGFELISSDFDFDIYGHDIVDIDSSDFDFDIDIGGHDYQLNNLVHYLRSRNVDNRVHGRDNRGHRPNNHLHGLSNDDVTNDGVFSCF